MEEKSEPNKSSFFVIEELLLFIVILDLLHVGLTVQSRNKIYETTGPWGECVEKWAGKIGYEARKEKNFKLFAKKVVKE